MATTESASEKRPRLTASVLLKEGEKFLLGRRNKVNAFGKWVIPGGGIDWGETMQAAAIREFREETGITANIERLICFKEIINLPGDYHSIVFFFLGTLKPNSEPSKMTASDDLSESRFFTVDEIKKLVERGETVKSVQSVLEAAGFWE